MPKLTTKQETFVREYLIDLNATQAAIRAGYSERSARVNGPRMLSNADVSARVKEIQEERMHQLGLDAYWVLKRLKDTSDRCMQAEPVVEWDRINNEWRETGEYQFDSQGSNRAAELIGKHIGMFTDKIKMDVNAQVVFMNEPPPDDD